MSPLFPACILAAFCILSGVSAQVRWVASSGGRVPLGSFVAGHQHGQQLYLCRAFESGDLIAGKLDTRGQACFIGYAHRERRQNNYDAAVGDRHAWNQMNVAWDIPPRAVLVGFSKGRERTYACRANHAEHLIPGKVHRYGCFVTLAGQEHRYNTYEILVDI